MQTTATIVGLLVIAGGLLGFVRSLWRAPSKAADEGESKFKASKTTTRVALMEATSDKRRCYNEPEALSARANGTPPRARHSGAVAPLYNEPLLR
jgi:hypothetical protein